MRRLLPAIVLLASIAALNVSGAADPWVKMPDIRLKMSDGVSLISDVYVPTVADADGDGLYPCVVELTPYRKELRYAEGAGYLPSQGIALIEVDARGTGGSQGEYDFTFSVREQADAAEWIEWAALAAKNPSGGKLCEETVGMYGGSYSGIIQYLVASLPETATGSLPARPPHLAAIAPQRAYGDLYRDIVYHGGMVIGSFGVIWSSGTTGYYTAPPTDVNTPDGQRAWLDHFTKNDPMMIPYLSNQYADATATMDDSTPQHTQKLYEDSSILPRIENLRVPTLHLAGWFDAFTRGQLRTFTEAYRLERELGGRGPNYLIVGPWNHSGTHFINPAHFKDRIGDWYRYWLEGKAAGTSAPAWFDEPRVNYFHMVTGKINSETAADGAWKTASDWPPPLARARKLRIQPLGLFGDPFWPVYCTDHCWSEYAYTPLGGTAETLSRWDNAAGTPQPQQDQRFEEGKGVVFTTPALDEPLSIAGPIGVRLFAGTKGIAGDPSLAPSWPGLAQTTPPYHDTDFVVKISDVAPDGTATLVTQGYLRASHRAVDPARSQYMDGLNVAPFHPHTRASLDPPPADGTPREYLIEVWPVAKTFAAGHSVRVDIYSSDTPNHLALNKPAINTVYYGSNEFDSYITLPVVG